MKKTLIALAVLAASGASFAQVTITGNVTMGYLAEKTGGAAGVNGSDAAGLGTDTSDINFNATEDIGGGYKAMAALSLSANPRAATTGNNGSLSLVTPGGVLTLATAKGGDYLGQGLAAQGGLYNGWDGKVFGARSVRDSIGYSMPLGAITLGVTYLETANQIGLGAGTVGAQATTGQSIVMPQLSYAAGGLKANIQYLAYASSGDAGNTKNVVRTSANYDFGGFVLGGGMSVATVNGNPASDMKVTDYLVSAAVPLGNVTLGANFASRRFDDSLTAQSGTATGYQLQASYALSKRTSVQGNYTNWTQTTATGVAPNKDQSNQYSLLLSHSF